MLAEKSVSMNIVLLSKTRPNEWGAAQPLTALVKGVRGLVKIKSKLHGECYLLNVECQTRDDALLLLSRTQDPSGPLVEWEKCPIMQQIDQPGSLLR